MSTHKLQYAESTRGIPKKPTLKTSWALSHHYYTSENDPQIEKDIISIERAYARFAKKYRRQQFTKSALQLRRALVDYETLAAHPGGRRVVRYFEFRHTRNARDTVAEKRLNLLEARLIKTYNEVLFFEIALGTIPQQLQKKYLRSPLLAHFRYFLERTFIEAKHTLSEPEEKILSLKAGPSVGMWIAGTEKIISKREIDFDKRSIAIPEAIELINTQKPEKKQRLWNLVLDELDQIAEVAENEFNAIIHNKRISDELRKYEKPYSQTLQSYENNEKSVEALVEAVSAYGFELSRRFYTLKAKFHKVSALPYVRKYDPIGSQFVIPFTQAVDICRDVFYGLKPTYGAIFDKMLHDGSIDVYPKRGKRGGAFMSADTGVPTFVMLNQTDDLASLTTLAHEMGHAIHAERSKEQTPLYEHHSITTAETASTLFENLLSKRLVENVSPHERRALLHDKITRDISTIQRQIAFYNYELALHTLIREQGAATKEEMRDLLVTHLRSYLGPAVKVTERDGLSFVYISHFRYGFYVYTYAYGQLVSSLMTERYTRDNGYIEDIDAFLRAGGSNTVEQIFESIGIDTTKVDTFVQGLDELKRSIDAFDELV